MSDNEERQLLLPTKTTITTYTTENREGQISIVTQQKEKRVWLWTSKSYVWSLTALVLLFVVFSGLEYALFKLNIPSVNP